MAESEYQGIEERFKVSIRNLYKHSEHILEQIEEGINEERKPFPIVGYQGVPGAFGEEATLTYFQSNFERSIAHEEFEDVFEALNQKVIDYGVVPIENSSAGEVLDTYDLIKKHNLYIVGEQVISVSHNLLGIPGTKIDELTEVYSHPQALSQSKDFLKQHKNIKEKAYVNTATACQFVAELGDSTKAAIGSLRAAELYGLEILQKNIHFNQNNFTRFIILARKMDITEKCDKISIVFTTAHTSGSLYNILGHFAYNGLNLLKIQSRPLLEKEWEYYFFADLEGNLQEANVLIALSKIKEQSKYFKILGNYKQAE